MSKAVLRAIKAKHGDSLLLFVDDVKVLIDGGPSGVYNQALRDQLLELDRDGEDQPRIDLMIVSHIDADHIDGVLDLTAELIEAREEEREPLVRIDQAWHNSFSDMVAKVGVDTSSQVKVTAANVASVIDELKSDIFNPHESNLVLSSVSQGRQLRLDLKALNIDLNKRFNDRIVLQGNMDIPWKKGNLKFSVVGPTERELEKLQKEWTKQVKKILEKEGAASVASAKALDTSVSNLASIVAIAQIEDKKILLTGDARGDMILNWLEQTGWLKPNDSVHFDVLKLPHHGSDRNVTDDFFKRITADHYLICGNGGHGNPEPKTFEMLFSARPELDYTVHMTYSPDELNTSKSYIKHDNHNQLESVLAVNNRKRILNFPDSDKSYVDIVV